MLFFAADTSHSEKSVSLKLTKIKKNGVHIRCENKLVVVGIPFSDLIKKIESEEVYGKREKKQKQERNERRFCSSLASRYEIQFGA